MTGKTLLASDLDRTLIWSMNALSLPSDHRERLVNVESYNHRSHSFITERAASIIGELNQRGALVPVTTRTVAQYERVQLPGPVPVHAVCLNGGRLLVNGVEDLDFTAQVNESLSCAAPYADVYQQLTALCAGGAVEFAGKLRSAQDTFCYLVLRQPVVPPAWLAELREIAEIAGWGVSQQERKVYLVPLTLSKASAVRSVSERVGGDRIVAAGDSALDADLLQLAHSGIVPRGSELGSSSLRSDHVTVTSSRGVLAGEEIAVWLHAAH